MLFVCLKIKIPAIVGFLITGILAGPHGFGLIEAISDVEVMAEIGVVLLLFTIGIEFSLKELIQIRKSVLLGGAIQVFLTIGIFFIVALKAAGQSVTQSVFMGFLMALSSTAIVLKLLQERAEMESPHGRTALAVLIFQDLIVVPMMLLTPIMAGTGAAVWNALLVLAVKIVGIMLFVVLSARWLVPKILYQITRTRNRELFLLCILFLCSAVAWLTYHMGLSLALGAFLAGLIISESEYSQEALGNILPFRDVFISIFFVSIGMLLNVEFFLDRIGIIFLIAGGVLLLKTLIAGFATFLIGYPLRTMLLTGFALSQVGEFSFVLSKSGIQYGLISQYHYQLFIAVSVLTMIATPFMIGMAPWVAEAAGRLALPSKLKTGLHPAFTVEDISQRDHLIVIGYGINGRNVTRAARSAGVPYIIIEMNPETVRLEKAKEEPIFYGDATHASVLEFAGITHARIIVIAIADAAATRKITGLARRLSSKVHIIARTRFLQEMEPLYEMGADEVIPEEFETSVEIFTRVLTKFLIPRNEIERFVHDVRSDGYYMLRSLSPESATCSDLRHCLPDIDINSFRVEKEAPLAGKSLAEIELRKKYGVTVLALRRGGKTISNPDVHMKFETDDILFILGTPDKFADITNLFYNSTFGFRFH